MNDPAHAFNAHGGHHRCVALGRTEPGKLADLVLLDGDPLEDIRNTQKIRAVVADGQLYRRADLDRLLAEVEALNHKVEKREKK